MSLVSDLTISCPQGKSISKLNISNSIRRALNSGLPITVVAVRIVQQHMLHWASLFGKNLHRSTAQRWKSMRK